VTDLIASVSVADWNAGEGLDVRLERQDETWVQSETFDDTTTRPANHVLHFLLGTATEAEQSHFTRCDLSSLTFVVVPSVVYDLAFHFLFHSHVINPVADAAERLMTKREAVNGYDARSAKMPKGTAEEETKAKAEVVQAVQEQCKLLNFDATFSVMPLHNVTPKHSHHQGAINALLSAGEKLWVLWPPGVGAPAWTSPRNARWVIRKRRKVKGRNVIHVQ
jgi:hypothetical protein